MIGALGPIALYYLVYFVARFMELGKLESGGIGLLCSLASIPIFYALEHRGDN